MVEKVQVTLDLHREIITPNLILQAVIETLTAMPKRKIARVMIIPGYGHNSESSRSGIQSCLVALLLAIGNIPIPQLAGEYLIMRKSNASTYH